MEIKITGNPKEIAALVDELQERRAEYERKSQVNRILEAFQDDRKGVREDEENTFKGI